MPHVIFTIDYYPFGQEMPGRVYSPTSYRFGFNGKENDNEVAGTGNWQNYGMREYDARVCRFISVDPLTKKYPELTPYQFASNSPVIGIDLDGLELHIEIMDQAKNAGVTKQSLVRFTKILQSVKSIVQEDPVFLKSLPMMTKLNEEQILNDLTYQDDVKDGEGLAFTVWGPNTISYGFDNPNQNTVNVQYEPLMKFENMDVNDPSFITSVKAYTYGAIEEWAHAKDKAANGGHNSGQGILTQGDIEFGVQDLKTSITGHRGTDPNLFGFGEYQLFDNNTNSFKISSFGEKFSNWGKRHGERWRKNIEKVNKIFENTK